MEDEELDDETTEEVLFTLFSIIIAGHSEASHIEKHSLSLQLLKNVKFILCYSCKILTAGRTCGGSIQYWQWQETSKLLGEEGQTIQEEAHGAVIVTA